MDPSAIDPSITAAIISTVGAWAWDAVGKGLASRLRGETSQQTEKFGWRDAAKTYTEELHKQHSPVLNPVNRTV